MILEETSGYIVVFKPIKHEAPGDPILMLGNSVPWVHPGMTAQPHRK